MIWTGLAGVEILDAACLMLSPCYIFQKGSPYSKGAVMMDSWGRVVHMNIRDLFASIGCDVESAK